MTNDGGADLPRAHSDAMSRCHRNEGLLKGFYEPLTLAIHLKSVLRQGSKEDLKRPLERSDASVVFLHEHSHLLQEVTTLSGLASFATYLRVIPRLAGYCQHAELVRLPITKGGERVQESEDWSQWREHSEGWINRASTDPPFNPDEDYEILAIHHEPSMNRVGFGRVMPDKGFPIHSTVVTVRQGATYDIHLGAYAISESLSNMLDGRLYAAASIERTSKAPPYPYDMLWSLASFVAGKEPLLAVLATFADRALMTLSPGYFVTKYLEEYAQHPNRAAHDICGQVERNEAWNLKEPLTLVHAVFSELAENFKVSPHKKMFMEWFTNYISGALENRLKDRDFYLTPFLSQDPWARCDELRKAVPPPLIIDGANKLSSYEDQEEDKGAFAAARLFQSLRFVVKVLTEEAIHPDGSPDVRCPIRDSCIHRSPTDDERCLSSPWIHADTLVVAEDGSTGTCATGSAFASLGIKDHKPVEPGNGAALA